MEWLYIELLLFIVALLFSVWLRRPRSALDRRIPYQDANAEVQRQYQQRRSHGGSTGGAAVTHGSAASSDSPPSTFSNGERSGTTHDDEDGEVAAVTLTGADYVVIGAGPGGLSAARALLTSDAAAHVYIIEAGRDHAPASDLTALLQYHTPERFPLFHLQSIAVPRAATGMRASAALPSHTTSRSLDWGWVARRPLLPPAAPPPTTSEGEGKPVDPLLSFACYPQGHGLGGTSMLGWGLGLPSMLAISPDFQTRVPRPWWRVLPLCRRVLHPLAWAFSRVLVITGARSSIGDLEGTSTTQRHKRQVARRTTRRKKSTAKRSDAEAAQGEEEEGEEWEEPVWRPWSTSPREGVVWQPLQHSDEDGRRLRLPHALWRGMSTAHLQRLHVLRGFHVVDFEIEPGETKKTEEGENNGSNETVVLSRVGAVVCREKGKTYHHHHHSSSSNTSKSSTHSRGVVVRIQVAKGVVMAAGVVGSPLLLRQLWQRRRRHQQQQQGSHAAVPPPLPLPLPSSSSSSSSLPHKADPEAGFRAIRIRDALVLPLLYKAQPGVTVDDVVRRTSNSPLVFFLRSLFLSTPVEALIHFTDLLCSIPLPELGLHAELVLLLLPFGGRNPALFYQLGIDRILSSYQDATIVLLVLTGVDGLHHPLQPVVRNTGDPQHQDQEEGQGKSKEEEAEGLCRRGAYPLYWPRRENTPKEGDENEVEDDEITKDRGRGGGGGEETAATAAEEEQRKGGNQRHSSSASLSSSSWSLSSPVQEKVVRAFLLGIQRVRACTRLEPLSLLLQGGGEQEALDFTLLREDPSKAARLARLMHTPPRKMSLKLKREVVELVQWARGVAAGEDYLKAYVQHHARWLGFGSGSSCYFLSRAEYHTVAANDNDNDDDDDDDGVSFSLIVNHYDNVVVGDCSAVSDGLFRRAARGNALLAGNMETAMDMGLLAARELANICGRRTKVTSE